MPAAVLTCGSRQRGVGQLGALSRQRVAEGAGCGRGCLVVEFDQPLAGAQPVDATPGGNHLDKPPELLVREAGPVDRLPDLGHDLLLQVLAVLGRDAVATKGEDGAHAPAHGVDGCG